MNYSVKKTVSEQQIIEAANLLVSVGKMPTLSAIRVQLGGRGSRTTIHKYLFKWKQQRFKQSMYEEISSEESVNVLEEKRNLEQTLNKQITQNEHYAQELINAEKINIALKEEIHQLRTTIQELQLELTEIKAVKNILEQVNEKIQNRLDVNDNDTITKMQQTIDGLRTELKTLNETSLAALRETSTNGHEALMQEKVTSINLQAKIASLNKELTESNKQLNAALMKTQVQNQPFLRQIEWQQQIIQNHIGFEKLRQIEEEELRLKFIGQLSQLEVSHGK